MSRETLSINDPKVEQCRCPSPDEGINKVGYFHTVEYYLATKRKEAWNHATAQINLEDMMLMKEARHERDKYCMIPCIGNV